MKRILQYLALVSWFPVVPKLPNMR